MGDMVEYLEAPRPAVSYPMKQFLTLNHGMKRQRGMLDMFLLPIKPIKKCEECALHIFAKVLSRDNSIETKH